jgi:hypothetical protein
VGFSVLRTSSAPYYLTACAVQTFQVSLWMLLLCEIFQWQWFSSSKCWVMSMQNAKWHIQLWSHIWRGFCRYIQKWFSLLLHVIHEFQHPTPIQPTNFIQQRTFMYSDSISLKKYLNWRHNIPCVLLNLTHFQTTIRTLLWAFAHRFSWCIKQWHIMKSLVQSKETIVFQLAILDNPSAQ